MFGGIGYEKCKHEKPGGCSAASSLLGCWDSDLAVQRLAWLAELDNGRQRI